MKTITNYLDDLKAKSTFTATSGAGLCFRGVRLGMAANNGRQKH